MKGNKKKFIILMPILFISIGFAYLSTQLNVNVLVRYTQSNWDVHFENIVVSTGSIEANPPTIINNTTVSFSATFKEPSEYYEFCVDIVNAGTMDAVLDDFIKSSLTETQEEYIDYTVKYWGNREILENDVLPAGYKEKIKVRVEYKYDIDELINLGHIDFSLQINYVKRNLQNTYNNEVWNIDYTGQEVVFTVPKTGTYKLEVWGAQGKSNIHVINGVSTGGYGGYSTGTIVLNKKTNLYISSGSVGLGKTVSFGGGGYGQLGGGGATHIATTSGTLQSLKDNVNSVIIVAGGGGGNDTCNNYIPSAGGFKGVNGYYKQSNTFVVSGGSQESNGTGEFNGSFGKGGSSYVDETGDSGGAGGSGFFGGDGSARVNGCGGGGSGYIGNSSLTDKSMYCYNCEEPDPEDENYDNIKTISITNVSEEPISQYAKIGNGFARITFIQ